MICKLCGREFEPVRGYETRQRYCSAACRNEATRRRGIESRRAKLHALCPTGKRACAECGKIFILKNIAQALHRRYCCLRCLHKAWTREHRVVRPKMAEERVCRFCGKKFEAHCPRHVFCSARCQQRDWHARHDAPRPTVATCRWCGQAFQDHTGRRIYCSATCRSAYYAHARQVAHGRGPRTIRCAQCGTEFVAKYRLQVYCSARCRRAAQAQRAGFHKSGPRTMRCAQCGAEFLGGNSRRLYCPDCRSKRAAEALRRSRARRPERPRRPCATARPTEPAVIELPAIRAERPARIVKPMELSRAERAEVERVLQLSAAERWEIMQSWSPAKTEAAKRVYARMVALGVLA